MGDALNLVQLLLIKDWVQLLGNIVSNSSKIEVKRLLSRCFINASFIHEDGSLQTAGQEYQASAIQRYQRVTRQKINSEMFALTGSPNTMCPSACPPNPVRKNHFEKMKKRNPRSALRRRNRSEKERRCQGQLLSLCLHGLWKKYAKKWILSASPAHTDTRRRTPTRPQKEAI